MKKEWEYYNHALVPTTAPHVTPDTSWMKDRRRWKELADGHYPLFARWTTDFDCQEETQWWYCIKDDSFDLSALKSKRRNTINRGLKYVEVRLILPGEYVDELIDVNMAARKGYGETFREEEKQDLKEMFCETKTKKCSVEYIGAFLKETGRLIGYGVYEVYPDWIAQSVIKTNPDYLKYDVNAAMAYFAVNRYMGAEFSAKYISNGSKNISHETNYHEYLIKYFGFRKVYCKLKIHYRRPVALVVKILYPCRSFIYKFNKNKILSNIISVLKMEEIRRSFV